MALPKHVLETEPLRAPQRRAGAILGGTGFLRMTMVAIYTRLSSDPTGEQTATHRQRRACESYADLRGWTVARVFEDVDLSAYKRGVVRPSYEEMLRLITSGHVDGILAWKLDRLVRRSAEFERLWATCDSSGVFLTSVMEPIDTSTDMGLALVRVLVAFASLESATSGIRLRAKFKDLAERGEPHNNRPAFGYTRGWKKVVPHEAEAIREAVDRLLAGDTTNAIAADWNRRGLKSATGVEWRITSLRKLLLASRNAGLRSLHGEVVGPGNWPAIITVDQYDRVVEILTDDRRKTSRSLQPYLLKGRLRCGKCGKKLVRYMHPRQRERMYQCAPPPAGCAGVSVRERFIEPWVTSELLERFSRTRYGAGSTSAWAGVPDYVVEASIQEYAENLKMLARDFFVERQITRDQYEEARDGMYARTERRFNIDQDSYRARELRGIQNRNQMRSRWEQMSLEEKQRVLAAEIVYVTVHPVRRRGSVFDPSRCEVLWVDDAHPDPRSSAWLTSKEVQARFGVSKSRVSQWVAEERLHPERLGNAYIFRRTDVDALQERRRAIADHDTSRPGDMPPEYLTTAEACVRLGMSVRTLRRRADECLIRTEWFGGHILGFHRADIDALLVGAAPLDRRRRPVGD